MTAGAVPRIAVIGGGFTGAAVATHLALRTPRRIEVDVIEPRGMLGGGVAYSSLDPAHRTNVAAMRMSLFSDDDGHFARWLRAGCALSDDPDAELPDGRIYPRRSVFGRYVRETLDSAAVSGCARVIHVRDRAVAVSRRTSDWTVRLASDRSLTADVVVLAVSHPPPATPPNLAWHLGRHPKFVANPWTLDALKPIMPIDNVIIMGTALSMADVVASLELRGHSGQITAFSRRGLLSRSHAAKAHAAFGDFAGAPPSTVGRLLRSVRKEISAAAAAGLPWQAVIDAVRRDGQTIWQCLDDGQRRLLLRRLRPYWEVHRYRVAPQVGQVIERRRAEGTLEVLAAELGEIAVRGGRIRCELLPREAPGRWIEADAFVVTTGPSHSTILESNPALRTLAAGGWIGPDQFGLGLAVDNLHRALRPDGHPAPALLVAGPLARATFGELMGLPQVTRDAEGVASVALNVIKRDVSLGTRRARDDVVYRYNTDLIDRQISLSLLADRA